MIENTQVADLPEQNGLQCQESNGEFGPTKGISRADETERLFRDGYCCSSAVFAAFADTVGMTTEQAAKLACPFGAGFGKLREVCGAVSGMTLLAGYLLECPDPSDQACKKELYTKMQAMCHAFVETEGSLICRELLGLEKGEELDEPAVRTEEYYRSRPCVRACRRAAQIVEEFILSDEHDGCAAHGGGCD